LGEFNVRTEKNLGPTYSIPHASLLGWVSAETRPAVVFLLPAGLFFAIFLVYPALYSFYLSFFLTDPRGQIVEFIGLENYRRLFTDPYFIDTLRVTVLFALYTAPTTLALALGSAYATYRLRVVYPLMRFLFAVPMAFSVATASVIWALMFNPSAGILNAYLEKLGFSPVFWLSDPAWALFSVSLVTIWLNFGFAYIVFLAGLEAIPAEIRESAHVEGAGSWAFFRYIALPFVSPQFFFLLVVSLIGAFQAFGQIHLLTQGGPMNATNVYVYNLYLEAFRDYRFGMASAMAVVLFLFVLFITFVNFRVIEKRVHYQ